MVGNLDELLSFRVSPGVGWRELSVTCHGDDVTTLELLAQLKLGSF